MNTALKNIAHKLPQASPQAVDVQAEFRTWAKNGFAEAADASAAAAAALARGDNAEAVRLSRVAARHLSSADFYSQLAAFGDTLPPADALSLQFPAH